MRKGKRTRLNRRYRDEQVRAALRRKAREHATARRQPGPRPFVSKRYAIGG